jgi:uncharacterized protein (TIGR02646 family)
MLQLASKKLSKSAQKHLDNLQKQVDDLPTFADKVTEAKRLWDGKVGGNNGKTHFGEIKKMLTEMCISTEICNYCEHNEAGDIEHIAPKTVFPECAFVWNNYLLVCKTCNTTHKSDKCYVLDDKGSVYEIKRGSGKPPYPNLAIINPRIENPTDFILLNTKTFTFEILGSSEKDKNKAEKTIEVLALNNRDTLKEARKKNYNAFYDIMNRLSRIQQAKSIAEIESILRPHEDLIKGEFEDLEELKKFIKQGYKKDIQNYPHPSVWYAIKMIDSKTNQKWQEIFEIIPEALDW